MKWTSDNCRSLEFFRGFDERGVNLWQFLRCTWQESAAEWVCPLLGPWSKTQKPPAWFGTTAASAALVVQGPLFTNQLMQLLCRWLGSVSHVQRLLLALPLSFLFLVSKASCGWLGNAWQGNAQDDEPVLNVHLISSLPQRWLCSSTWVLLTLIFGCLFSAAELNYLHGTSAGGETGLRQKSLFFTFPAVTAPWMETLTSSANSLHWHILLFARNETWQRSHV